MTNSGTILIVEDNEPSTEMVKELLEEMGFQTLEADDADTSIQLAKQEHPDLILMDVYLPGKNGYEASQALKSDPETHDIPIVAFTALAMQKDRQRAESAGCIGLISKPIDVDTFALTVSSFLSESRNEAEALMSTQTVSLSTSEDPEKEFLLKLSHDLQGPIRKVNQFSNWLKKSTEEKLSPEDQDFLNGIDRATQQMQDVLSTALAEFRTRRE
jgi:two-component system cell cycle response regulator DivK